MAVAEYIIARQSSAAIRIQAAMDHTVVLSPLTPVRDHTLVGAEPQFALTTVQDETGEGRSRVGMLSFMAVGMSLAIKFDLGDAQNIEGMEEEIGNELFGMSKAKGVATMHGIHIPSLRNTLLRNHCENPEFTRRCEERGADNHVWALTTASCSSNSLPVELHATPVTPGVGL